MGVLYCDSGTGGKKSLKSTAVKGPEKINIACGKVKDLSCAEKFTAEHTEVVAG
jgi:hypothetical protein